MILPLRLFVLLAISSAITALPQYGETHTSNLAAAARATTETCFDDTYTTCGGNLPSNFCCSAGSTCIVSYGFSSIETTTAVCCPKGSNCTYIMPVVCDVQMFNVTAYPDSPILSTELDVTLQSCGTQCCPPGFECQGGACFLIAENVATKISAGTATTAAPLATTATRSVSSPTSSSTLRQHSTTALSSTTSRSSSQKTPSATSAPTTSAASSAATLASNSSTATSPATTTGNSPNRTVIAAAVTGAVVGIVLVAILCLYFRRYLLAGWLRFVSLVSSFLPSFSSSRSTHSSSSSVRYITDETSQPPSQLQHPAPTWAIPLSSDYWWEPVKRKYPRIVMPWQSPRQSPKQSPRESSQSSSLDGVLPRSHTLSTTFTTTLSSAGLPLSQYNAHHEPETGIVTSPPSRSAALFAAKQQLKVAKKAAKAAKAAKKEKRAKIKDTKDTAKAARKICNRLSSSFYRFKTLPPLPQSYSPLLQSDFASVSGRPHQPERREMTAVNHLYGPDGHPEQIPAPIVLQEVEGSPVLVGSKTPQSTQSSGSSHSYSNGGKYGQGEVEREHNTPLLPMPVQPQSQSQFPQRPSPSPWPRPLQLSRHSSTNVYTGYSVMGQAVEHGRSASDTLPRRQRMGIDNYDAHHQRHQTHQRITQFPSVWQQPLPDALQSLPSQTSAFAPAPPSQPHRQAPESATPQSTRSRMYHPPRRSMSPIELPATPVTSHMLGAFKSPPPRVISNDMPINAFGIISDGGEGEGSDDLVQRQMLRQRPRLYHELPCGHEKASQLFAPMCPYPEASYPISLPPTPPPTRPRNQSRDSSGPHHPRFLPSLKTDAPPVLPPIPAIPAIQARFRSPSPLSMVIYQQQMQQQQSNLSTRPSMSPDVETPMSYQSQTMLSPISPNTPRIEEAQVQRLPRMAQARMMEQHTQPCIAIVVHPPPSEALQPTRSNPRSTTEGVP